MLTVCVSEQTGAPLCPPAPFLGFGTMHLPVPRGSPPALSYIYQPGKHLSHVEQVFPVEGDFNSWEMSPQHVWTLVLLPFSSSGGTEAGCNPPGVTRFTTLPPSSPFLFMSENWPVVFHPPINTASAFFTSKKTPQLKLPALVLRGTIEICRENMNVIIS